MIGRNGGAIKGEERWLTASEIGQWGYCHRAWWLAYIRGESPGDEDIFLQGLSEHASHARTVRKSQYARYAALLLLAIALLLLGLTLLLYLGGGSF